MWYIIPKMAEAKEKRKKKTVNAVQGKKDIVDARSVMEMLTDFSSEPLIQTCSIRD